MKYSATMYAQAFVAALTHEGEGKKETQAVMAKNFLKLVRESGDETHLEKILEETERLLRQKDGTRKLVVESARPLDAHSQTLIKKLAHHGDIIEEKISPELIAGIKITANDEMQFDGSLKSKLDKVFGMV
jgi:F0F1-type ATP synthase delta subunit